MKCVMRTCTRACVHGWVLKSMRACTDACMYVCNASLHASMPTCRYACTYAPIHACMNACMYVWNICMHMVYYKLMWRNLVWCKQKYSCIRVNIYMYVCNVSRGAFMHACMYAFRYARAQVCTHAGGCACVRLCITCTHACMRVSM